MQTTKSQVKNYVLAGYPGLFIVSHEEQAVEKDLAAVAAEVKFDLYTWSITDGIVKIKGSDSIAIAETQDPIAALDKVQTLVAAGVKDSDKEGAKVILILRDFHLFLIETNPMVYRKLKDTLALCKVSNRVLVITGCRLTLPPELEKEITVIEHKLPDREQLRTILESVAEGNNIKLNGNTDKILDAAGGLTTIEAENAFSLSYIESKSFDAEIISREKSNTVRKSGLLEIIDEPITLADIGGLENLKDDLTDKRNLFTKEAREYGLPTPRGILAVGQPGTGKSLTAKATGSIFGIPLVRLEAGRIFGSLVGESERNWRNAFATAKAISPCVMWIDEIDGLFAGAGSSGQTDGGTTARVIKAILQDMQFNGDGIFFVFTANDIDGLPDALIDRLDVWSVDLPTQSEREAIWEIHIAKRKRNPKKFNLNELARNTEGFSGRQIEQVWLKAMTRAFNAKREPHDKDIADVSKGVVATSITMADSIKRRQERLKDRATPASRDESKTPLGGGRKLVK